MIDRSEPPQYSTGHVKLAVLLVLSALFPSIASSQSCGEAKNRIYQITESKAQQTHDSLRTLLDMAIFVRGCEGDISLELELWLLNNEVFALDKLAQHDEARARVDRFFNRHFARASDYYRARFYLWRLHLDAANGDVLAMVKSYVEAQQYAHALDDVHRAHLHLNGSYSYFEVDQYEQTLALTQQALNLIPTPETHEERLMVARALLLSAESGLWLGNELPPVRQQLDRAAALYGLLGDTAQVAIATMLRGVTYAAESDTSRALVVMQDAAQLARQSGNARSQAYTLWRYGKLLREWRDWSMAQPILLQAFEIAEAHQEFYLETAYELARLYEQQRKYEQATRLYRVIVDAPRPSSYVASLKAQRQAQQAQIRLLLIENERDQQRYRYALVALLIVLITVGFVFLLRLKSPPSHDKHASNGVYIPKNMPTGLTLEELEQRFQKMVRSEKLGSRLAYLYAVLFDPELILAYIKDSYYASQVAEDRVENNTALLLCAAAVEEARTGVAFTGKTENTLRSYLRGEFENRGWEWPKHPVLWKRYFLEFHVERLFSPS